MYLITVNTDECINLDTVERIIFGKDVHGMTALVVFLSKVSKQYHGDDAQRLQAVCRGCIAFDAHMKPKKKT